MKRINLIFLFLWIVMTSHAQPSWVGVNQVGYLKDDMKVAVWISKGNNLSQYPDVRRKDQKKKSYLVGKIRVADYVQKDRHSLYELIDNHTDEVIPAVWTKGYPIPNPEVKSKYRYFTPERSNSNYLLFKVDLKDKIII